VFSGWMGLVASRRVRVGIGAARIGGSTRVTVRQVKVDIGEANRFVGVFGGVACGGWRLWNAI